MATRFYLPSTGAAAVNPTNFDDWTVNDNIGNLACVTTKILSSLSTDANTSVDENYSHCLRQFVSASISGDQTITGTVSAVVMGSKYANQGDVSGSRLRVVVVDSAGTTLRGTLLSLYAGSSEFYDSLTNRLLANAVGVSSVAALNGDRIVIQIGVYGGGGTAAKRKAQYRFGDASGSDLQLDDSTTDDYNPWVELSFNITWPAPPVRKRFISG